VSRTATLVTVLLVVTAGAWWGGLLHAPADLPARPTPVAPPTGAVQGPPLLALDRLRRVPPPPPADAGRDPFQPTGALVQASVGGRVGPGGEGEVPPEDDTRTTPSWPRLELIGIAERTADGGEARVAIVAGTRGVHHVRAGEIVEQVYRIERVWPDAIEVRLVPEDRVFRVGLR
jgi:hypothetical protein